MITPPIYSLSLIKPDLFLRLRLCLTRLSRRPRLRRTLVSHQFSSFLCDVLLNVLYEPD